MTNNKISSLIKVAAIMAVSMSSYAQSDSAFGVRFGAQWLPDFCSVGTLDSCKNTALVANPYMRLHLDGPHNIEIGGRLSLTDYVWNAGTDILVNSSTGHVSYEYRPLDSGGSVGIRIGWHTTTLDAEVPAARGITVSEGGNGFFIGASLDVTPQINVTADYADWEGDEAISLLLGFEI